jgi:hypothetical protein
MIERHKLRPVNGEFHFSSEQLDEAIAYDKERGTKPTTSPEALADLKAMLEGKPNSGDWQEMDMDEIERQEAIDRSKMRKVMTDDAYANFLKKLHNLFVEEQPPHELALQLTTHMAVGLAVAELKMDTPAAKAWFSAAFDDFADKLAAHNQKHQN